jgi:hypothetical protein
VFVAQVLAMDKIMSMSVRVYTSGNAMGLVLHSIIVVCFTHLEKKKKRVSI